MTSDLNDDRLHESTIRVAAASEVHAAPAVMLAHDAAAEALRGYLIEMLAREIPPSQALSQGLALAGQCWFSVMGLQDVSE